MSGERALLTLALKQRRACKKIFAGWKRQFAGDKQTKKLGSQRGVIIDWHIIKDYCHVQNDLFVPLYLINILT